MNDDPRDGAPARGFITTRLRDLVAAFAGGLRASSLTPFLAGHCGCRLAAESCAARLAAEPGPLEMIAATPRDADLLLVAGAVNERLAPCLLRVWRQMPAPRQVVAWGQCAVSGGLFEGGGVLQGVDRILPVDVHVPGCPPDDAATRRALELLVSGARPRRQRPGPEDAGDPWRFGAPSPGRPSP